MLGPDDLLVTASSLGHPPFRELVEAASAGGFAGVSIWPQESYAKALAAGQSDADLRQMAADAGVVVNDVDALVCWVGDDAPPAGDEAEALLLRAGEALGARIMNVVMMSNGPAEVDRMAERFAGVFDRAAERGLVAQLEFVPFMSVPDARTALAVVEAAERPAAGLMVDTWHCFRGPTEEADLRGLPGARVLGIQVNDAPAEPMENPVEETLHHRLVPGEGAIALPAILGALRAAGSRAPLTAEVFSDDLVRSGSAREIAVRLGDAMRALQARLAGG